MSYLDSLDASVCNISETDNSSMRSPPRQENFSPDGKSKSSFLESPGLSPIPGHNNFFIPDIGEFDSSARRKLFEIDDSINRTAEQSSILNQESLDKTVETTNEQEDIETRNEIFISPVNSLDVTVSSQERTSNSILNDSLYGTSNKRGPSEPTSYASIDRTVEDDSSSSYSGNIENSLNNARMFPADDASLSFNQSALSEKSPTALSDALPAQQDDSLEARLIKILNCYSFNDKDVETMFTKKWKELALNNENTANPFSEICQSNEVNNDIGRAGNDISPTSHIEHSDQHNAQLAHDYVNSLFQECHFESGIKHKIKDNIKKDDTKPALLKLLENNKLRLQKTKTWYFWASPDLAKQKISVIDSTIDTIKTDKATGTTQEIVNSLLRNEVLAKQRSWFSIKKKTEIVKQLEIFAQLPRLKS